MELYTLDGLLRRTEIVEGYETFIWTERFSNLGELEIIAPSTQQFRNLLASGTMLGLSESKRVMEIQTITDSTDADGSKMLSIKGEELSSVLKHRIAMTSAAVVKPNTWRATATPRGIINMLFDYVCRNGSSSLTDKLPLLVGGSLYTDGTLVEDGNTYIVERPTSRLYDAIQEVAEVYDLGFRLYKGDDNGKLYFDVYKGNDRTTSQTVRPPVIFAESLDSLQSVSELASVANSKNVAYVKNGALVTIVYANGTSVETSGFAKRTLYVDATNIEYPERTNSITDDQQKAINKTSGLKEALDTHKAALQKLIGKTRLATGEASLITAFTTSSVSASLITSAEKTLVDSTVTSSTALEAAEASWMSAAMILRGNEELAKNRSISAFDGEITQLSPYKYNQHYNMGDLVEMRNATGLANQMLVTEQIFTSDATGERAYPTLTNKLFITPGSWMSWENSQTWEIAPGTWATS